MVQFSNKLLACTSARIMSADNNNKMCTILTEKIPTVQQLRHFCLISVEIFEYYLLPWVKSACRFHAALNILRIPFFT